MMTRNSRIAATMLNKVPEVTIYFWIIKILCTTVGETASDYLNGSLGFGLTRTSAVMSVLLVVILIAQLKARKYNPPFYWASVVMISIVGTLITDNLSDNIGVPLEVSTIVFSTVLGIAFVTWYAFEKTLSIHTIVTTRREAFYWLAILFTFALGTAAGDLSAELSQLGYLVSIFMFGGLIALVTLAYYGLRANAVLAFWLAYILTRPLGASIGDFLAQARADRGLGLGPTETSYLFLVAIVAVVGYLTVTRKDEIRGSVQPQGVPVFVQRVATESVESDRRTDRDGTAN
jgi:uncharacterized membrane-anchored protein